MPKPQPDTTRLSELSVGDLLTLIMTAADHALHDAAQTELRERVYWTCLTHKDTQTNYDGMDSA